MNEKTTNGTRWLTFGDMSVKIGKGQRHVVGDHQHQEPYAEAEQYERGVDAHDGSDERRYALAAPEIGEDREDVSHHGGEHGDETQDVEPVFIGPVGEYAVVFHQVDDRHRHKPLQKIEPEYGQCGPPAQHAQYFLPIHTALGIEPSR